MKADNLKIAIDHLKRGAFIVLEDDLSEKIKYYALTYAGNINENKISWAINNLRGLIFIVCTEREASSRKIAPTHSDTKNGFRFSSSIEAREGVRSGISAKDRASTIKSFFSASNINKSFISPGHIFPIISKDGGLLVSYGISEAATDILKLSNLTQIGVLINILNSKGDSLDQEEIASLCKNENIPKLSLSNLIKYQLTNEPLVIKEAQTKIPTKEFGTLTAHGFRSIHDQIEHIAFTLNLDGSNTSPILTRMHSEMKLGDIFHLSPEGGRKKLLNSLKAIKEEGRGAFVYIRKSNLGSSSKELESSEKNSKKVTELRELGVGAQILKELNINAIKLLSSSKNKLPDLSAFNIKVFQNE